MSKITLDAVLRSKLPDLSQPLELCDEAGKVVARITPVLDPAEWDLTEPPYTEEELQQSERSDKWYTTAEVLAHLKSLEKQ
ncbi:MAG: hypothetical protein K2R98_00925 [Gemmataceae bacterium]|nr:hypothetical protein [Gemmataceae bacterium]